MIAPKKALTIGTPPSNIMMLLYRESYQSAIAKTAEKNRFLTAFLHTGTPSEFSTLQSAARDAVPEPCKPFEKGLSENFYLCEAFHWSNGNLTNAQHIQVNRLVKGVLYDLP